MLPPCVCSNAKREICIAVNVLKGMVWFISMKNLKLEHCYLAEFRRQWKGTLYPIARAAVKLLQNPRLDQAAQHELEKFVCNEVPPAVALFEAEARPDLALQTRPTTWAEYQEMKMSIKKAKEGQEVEAAPVVEAVPAAKKEPKPKIGDLIIDMLLAGCNTETILLEVAERFPESRTKAANVAWYKSKLYAEGRLQKKPKVVKELKAKKVVEEAA